MSICRRLNVDLANFVSVIYRRKFRTTKTQARRISNQIKSTLDTAKYTASTVQGKISYFLCALANAMIGSPPAFIRPPLDEGSGIDLVSPANVTRSISLALLSLRPPSSASVQRDPTAYESHLRSESSIVAELVLQIRACFKSESIFVAVPHRVQVQTVRKLLEIEGLVSGLDQVRLEQLGEENTVGEQDGPLRVDTIERLQGKFAR